MAGIGLKRSRLPLVLGALAVLAGLAGLWILLAPTLEEYRLKRHIDHAVSRSEALQVPLREFIERTGFWPGSELDARLDPSLLAADRVIDDMRLGASTLVTVTFQAGLKQIGGETLIFVPEKTAEGVVRWRCDAGTLDPALRPSRCVGRDPVAARQPPAAPRLPDLPAPVREVVARQQDPLADQARKVRNELERAVNDTRHIRNKATQYLYDAGELPTSNALLGLPEPNKLAHGTAFRRIGVQPNGAILFEFGDRIAGMDGHRFSLAPTGLPGVWRCESGLPADYLPALCSKQIL
jgi:type IV pilus assembly protein PilA